MNLMRCAIALLWLEDLGNNPFLNLLFLVVMSWGDLLRVHLLFGSGCLLMLSAAPGDDPYLTGCWDNEWGHDGPSPPGCTSSTSLAQGDVPPASVGVTPGEWTTSSASSLPSSSAWPLSTTSWTYENYTAHMASAWDEELSLELQEEELESAVPEVTPEAIHVPTTVLWSVQSTMTWEAQQQQDQLGSSLSMPSSSSWQSSSSSSPWTPGPSTSYEDADYVNMVAPEQQNDNVNMAALEQHGQTDRDGKVPVADWWEAIKDKRNIRGRSLNPRPSESMPADIPPYARDPSTLLGPVATTSAPFGGTRDPPPHGETSSSSSSVCESEDPWLAWSNSENQGVNVSDGDTEPGVIQRFGKWRVGRDRWHRPDGSLINRGRHDLATCGAENSQSQELPSIAEEEVGLAVSGVSVVSGEPVVTVNTPAGETFYVRSSLPGPECSSDANSTTASSGAGASSSSTSSVGFWQHGQWIARPRTAQELRAHIGGRGQQRMQRKMQRVQDWQRGLWKPAWLVQYARDKERRLRNHGEVGQAPEPGDVNAEQLDATTTESAPSSSWQSPTEEWTQDPVSGWWSCSSVGSASTNEPTQQRDLWSDWSVSSGPSAWNWTSTSTTTTWGLWTTCSTTWTTSTSPSTSSLATSSPCSAWWVLSYPDMNSSSGTLAALEMGVNFVEGSSSTTSSTTASVGEPTIPGHGLFPDVQEVEALHDETTLMQLTPAERTRLSEDGVPNNIIDRLEAFFESLQRLQDEERGPESRWGVGRIHQRLQDGMEALETLFEVVGRRLVPRGYWPVQRLPSSDAARQQMFQWACHFGRMAADLLQAHLQTPLQGEELNTISQFLHDPPPPGHGDEAGGLPSPLVPRTSENGETSEAVVNEAARGWESGFERDGEAPAAHRLLDPFLLVVTAPVALLPGLIMVSFARTWTLVLALVICILTVPIVWVSMTRFRPCHQQRWHGLPTRCNLCWMENYVASGLGRLAAPLTCLAVAPAVPARRA